MKTLITRKLFPLLAGCVLVVTGCASLGGSSAADSAMMKAYSDYKDAWNRHDVEAITSYYALGGTLTNPAAGGEVSGPALTGWLQATFAAIPDFKVKVIEAAPVDAQHMVEQWVISGTWTNPFPGGPLAGALPTGKSFHVPGAGFFRWDGGKIVSATHYFDQMALLTQIGVIPSPGESPQASAR